MRRGFYSSKPVASKSQAQDAVEGLAKVSLNTQEQEVKINSNVYTKFAEKPNSGSNQKPATNTTHADVKLTEEECKKFTLCLQLLEGPKDEQRFLGLLFLTRMLPRVSGEDVRRALATLGFPFLARLLLPLSKDHQSSSRQQQEVLTTLGVSVLAAAVGRGLVPEMAAAAEVVAAVVPACVKILNAGGVRAALSSCDSSVLHSESDASDSSTMGDAVDILSAVASTSILTLLERLSLKNPADQDNASSSSSSAWNRPLLALPNSDSDGLQNVTTNGQSDSRLQGLSPDSSWSSTAPVDGSSVVDTEALAALGLHPGGVTLTLCGDVICAVADLLLNGVLPRVVDVASSDATTSLDSAALSTTKNSHGSAASEIRELDPKLYGELFSLGSTLVKLYMLLLSVAGQGGTTRPLFVDEKVMSALVKMVSASAQVLGNRRLLKLSKLQKVASKAASKTALVGRIAGNGADDDDDDDGGKNRDQVHGKAGKAENGGRQDGQKGQEEGKEEGQEGQAGKEKDSLQDENVDVAVLQLKSLELLTQLLTLAAEIPFAVSSSFRTASSSMTRRATSFARALQHANRHETFVVDHAGSPVAENETSQLSGTCRRTVKTFDAWGTAVRRGCTWLLTARVSAAERHRTLRLLHLATRVLGESWLLKSLDSSTGVASKQKKTSTAKSTTRSGMETMDDSSGAAGEVAERAERASGGGVVSRVREEEEMRKTQGKVKDKEAHECKTSGEAIGKEAAAKDEGGAHFFRVLLEVLHIELHMLLLDAIRPNWSATVSDPKPIPEIETADDADPDSKTCGKEEEPSSSSGRTYSGTDLQSLNPGDSSNSSSTNESDNKSDNNNNKKKKKNGVKKKKSVAFSSGTDVAEMRLGDEEEDENTSEQKEEEEEEEEEEKKGEAGSGEQSGGDRPSPSSSSSSFDPDTTLAWVAAAEEARKRREHFARIQEPVPNALLHLPRSASPREGSSGEGGGGASSSRSGTPPWDEHWTTGQRAEAMLPTCFALLGSCTEVISCLAEKMEGGGGGAAAAATMPVDDGLGRDDTEYAEEEEAGSGRSDELVQAPECSARDLPDLPESTVGKFFERLRLSVDELVEFFKAVKDKQEALEEEVEEEEEEAKKRSGGGFSSVSSSPDAASATPAFELPSLGLRVAAACALLDFLGEAPDLEKDRAIAEVLPLAQALAAEA